MDSDTSPQAKKKRRLHVWFPVAVVLAAVITIPAINASDNWIRVYISILVGLVAFGLIGIWCVIALFRTWRARLLAAAISGLAVVLGGMALKNSVRMAGSYGNGLPILEWKWADSGELIDLPEISVSPPIGREEEETGLSDASRFQQFLGPLGDGYVTGIDLDPDWATHPPELVWKREIGLGWSGFVVDGGCAVTQEQRGEMELVTCYDLATGDPVWVHENEARFSEIYGGTGPRATPTISGGRVFSMGAVGHLDCLDLRSGQQFWGRNILSEHDQGNLQWGKSCAPLVYGDKVIVTGGSGDGPSLLAYSIAEGEPLWTASEGGGGGYATPVATVIEGVEQVVTVNATSVSGHDPVSGTTLWNHEWPGNFPKVGQPIVIGGSKVLVTASYTTGAMLIAVSKGEAGGFSTAEEWRSMHMKTKFSSAIVVDGFAYGLHEGRFSCIDLTDGKRRWREAKYGYGQNLLVGDLFLIQQDRGKVVLARGNPKEFAEVASFPALKGKTWNPPALAGDLLLVRNAEEAACYRVKLRGEEP